MAGLAATLRRHERVGLDTPVFIYHIEGTARLAEPAGVALDELADGAFAGVTSVLTLMEIAVKPLQVGRPEVAEEYEVLLTNYPNLAVAAIDRPIACRAAELRARHRLRPADALQVAACLEQGATAFLTNDRELRRLTELQVLILEDFVAPQS
ncbi:MAG TPA: PIN domain-containing protein [Candidatus Dormibacteraeota bacterium]|jgi:predicted nucleic acid-binding protein|nr:PIN domain-containing protein [Candidatus Dormibacteraeota bacterium]